MIRLKTLADFKRAMKPGTKWRFHAYYLKEPCERECTKATTMGAYFTIPWREGVESGYLEFPKARDCKIISCTDTGGKQVYPADALRIEWQDNSGATHWLYYQPILETEHE